MTNIKNRKARDDDKTSHILRERGINLSYELTKKNQAGTLKSGLCFLLSGETYCIDTEYVEEVLLLKDLTPLPCTPPFVMGIINTRGKILSVLNLKKFLNLPDKGITNLNRVIRTRYQDIDIGLLVDEVTENIQFDPEKIQPSISTLSDKEKEFLKGVYTDGTIFLEISKFLSDNRIIVDEEV